MNISQKKAYNCPTDILKCAELIAIREERIKLMVKYHSHTC
jgi:hypothetical protein